MSSLANTVTISTNLNVDPYYDDFNENKNFHRILFRPGMAVQARELTQMQSILQNQIDRFAEHVFKEGSVVRGCEIKLDNSITYLKLRDKAADGTTVVNVYSFVFDNITGSTSGVKANVIAVNDGSEANTPNVKTLFVKYTGANGTNRTFANGEILISGDGYTANLASSSATGYTSIVRVGYGVIYAKDHFIRVDEQLLILDKYSANSTYRVGFEIVESIVNDTQDETLLDPAAGSYNYAAPGAARFKLEARLVKKSIQQSTSNNFAELMVVRNGIIQNLSDKPQYDVVRDYLAQRTYDESGNYVVNGLQPRIREHLLSGDNQGVYTAAENGSSDRLVVEMSPGKAYIMGYDHEFIVSHKVTIDKAIDYASVEQVSTTADYGNYITVMNMSGQWDVNGQNRVTLRDAKMNSITNGVYSTTALAGNIIGYARVRAIEYSSGTPGLPSCQYNLYLTDIKMEPSKSFTEVKSIGYDTSAADGKADVLNADGTNASTTDSSFDIGVFALPVTATKTIRDTTGAIDTNFRFKKSFDVAFSTGAGSAATLSTGDASETFSGSGTLSDTATRTGYYVVSRGTSNTTNLTGTITVTSGSTTVSGSGTQFDSQLSPGDIIACSPSQKFIVSSIASAVSLTLTANAASSTGGSYHKRFLEGQVIDFSNKGGGGDRSISVGSSTQTTFNLNENLNGALNATVITELNKVDGREAAKNIIRDRIVQLSLTSDVAGPWSLGLSDGFRLVSVRKKSGSAFTTLTEGTDVTSHFTLDSGMRDSLYEHARLVKKPTSGLSLASGDRLLVKFDHFTHSYSGGVGYFSVDSYPVSDSTAGTDTTKIYTYEIPVYTSPRTGRNYDLRDCVDIRPRMTDTAASVSTISGMSTNPSLSTSLDLPTGGMRFAAPGENFTMDLDYYLKRNDRIVIDKNGNFKAIRGQASLKPITPDEPMGSMSLATVSLSPYPSLPDEQARRVLRTDLASALYPIKNPRFTMKDIGVLRDRIENLEYYTSLSLLELNTKSLLVQDSSGNDRFKNGIIVDQFLGHNIGDVRNPDYKIAIDPAKGEARPPFKMDNIELFYNTANSINTVRTNVRDDGVSRDQVITIADANAPFIFGEQLVASGGTAKLRYKVGLRLYVEDASTNFTAGTIIRGTTSAVQSTITAVSTTTPGDLITLPYSHMTYLSQSMATTTRNAAGLLWQWRGNVELNPNTDYWTDTVNLPDVQVNVNLFSDNWLNMPSAWGTQWNSWQTVWQGTKTDVDVVKNLPGPGNAPGAVGGTGTSTITTTTTETLQSRTGTQFKVTPAETKTNLGPRVISSNIIPFMRSRSINFVGRGLRPGSRVYPFFDGTNVTSYVTPTDSSYNATAVEGSALTVSNTGDVYGIFRIPADNNLRFRVGSKVFRLTDNINNQSGLGLTITSAEGTYTAEGLSQEVQNTITSTRYPEITTSSVNETTTVVNKSVNTVFSPDPLPPPPPTIVEVPVPVPVEVVKEIKVPGPVQYVEVIKEVPVDKVVYVDREVVKEVEKEVIKTEYVTRDVVRTIETPGPTTTVYVDRPVIQYVDRIVEKIVQVPGPVQTVTNTVYVDRPVEVIRTVIVEVPVQPADNGWSGSDGNGDGGGGGDEPIAQSFLMDTRQFGYIGAGAFATKVDIFFATKHQSIGVEIHIRDIDPVSHMITSRIVPFSRVVLQPNDVNISENGFSPTPVYFQAPVFLQNGREYAVVVKPVGANPGYNVFVARLGDVDIATGNRITTSPAVGMLFVSSNDVQYSPVQEEDLKFNLYVANFLTSGTAAAVFKNELRDYLMVSNVSSAFSSAGEIVHGETVLTGTFANTKSVNTGVTYVQGMISGATATVSRYDTKGIRIRDVSTTNKFLGGERIRIRNTNATTGTIIGNSTGPIRSSTTPVGRVAYYNPTGFSNTYLHLANVAFVNSGPANTFAGRVFHANTFIRGQSGGQTAYIYKLESLRADVINLNMDYIQPSNTGISFYGKFATSPSGRDTSFLTVPPNDNLELSAPRFVHSRSIESNTAASSSTMASTRSAEITIGMASQSPFVSPVIDTKRISLITVHNLINANTSGEANASSGGGADAKYITRKITLADGQDAEDIRVYVSAYRPSGSDVLVYYKVLHREDSDTFDNSRWIPMDVLADQGYTASTVYSSSEDQDDFKEYVYGIPDYGNTYRSGANTVNSDIIEYRNSTGARFVGYKYLSIKVVLTNTTTTRPPRLDDIRVIALQR